MRIDIATLFPEMCEAVLCESIIGRAREAGLLEVYCHNIRDYTQDKHRRVDDTPYGGGMGMVMQADPIFRCYEAVCAQLPQKPHVIYLSPQGKVLTQQMAVEYSRQQYLFLLCGHYEGVDERVLEEIVDEELSIGDYVLTGGELPALVFVDTVGRLCEGVLADESCFTEESHFNGLWSTRSIPGRRSGMEKRCRRFCSAGITPTSAVGGGSSRCCAPGTNGRTCWRRLCWTLVTSLFWMGKNG